MYAVSSGQAMLVQAKRRDDEERAYGSLHKRNRPKGPRRGGLQVEQLIANAKRYRLPLAYAFYNHLSDAGLSARVFWPCSFT